MRRKTRGAAGDFQPPHRAQRRQRLAAEAEALDVEQIAAVDLGGGVTRQRQGQILGAHATAIIGDADQRLAAMGHLDQHAPRPRVERVFHQLLHRRGRTFHDLARRDPVDRGFIQLADEGTAHIGVITRHTAKPSMSPGVGPRAERSISGG